MILMIDNYDSFVYNLVQYLGELKEDVKVYRNDELSIEDIRNMNPDMIVISPGPCTPLEAGISIDVVKKLAGEYPILGICLGHQTIGHVYGATVKKAIEPVHGKVHPIDHINKGVFTGLNNPLNVTRYHSLIIDPETISDEFEITARTKEGEVMGMRHKELPLEGVQFHPEAILTEQGHDILKNFLDQAKRWRRKG